MYVCESSLVNIMTKRSVPWSSSNVYKGMDRDEYVYEAEESNDLYTFPSLLQVEVCM